MKCTHRTARSHSMPANKRKTEASDDELNKSKWLQCIFDEDTFFARFAFGKLRFQAKKKRKHYSLDVLPTDAPPPTTSPTSSTITFLTYGRARVVFAVPYRCPLCWQWVLFQCRPNWNMHTEYPNGVFYAGAHRCRIIVISAMVGADGWIEKPKNE